MPQPQSRPAARAVAKPAPPPAAPQPSVPDLIATIDAGARQLKTNAGGYAAVMSVSQSGSDLGELRFKLPIRYNNEILEAALDMDKLPPDSVPDLLASMADTFTAQLEETALRINVASSRLLDIIRESREASRTGGDEAAKPEDDDENR